MIDWYLLFHEQETSLQVSGCTSKQDNKPVGRLFIMSHHLRSLARGTSYAVYCVYSHARQRSLPIVCIVAASERNFGRISALVFFNITCYGRPETSAEFRPCSLFFYFLALPVMESHTIRPSLCFTFYHYLSWKARNFGRISALFFYILGLPLMESQELIALHVVEGQKLRPNFGLFLLFIITCHGKFGRISNFVFFFTF